MFAVSQIIERNLHRHPGGGSVLWINPEEDDAWRTLESHCSSLRLFTQDFARYTYLKQSGAEVEFAAFPTLEKDKYDWVIINLPRQKALLAMMLECTTALLANNGVLWLAGENKAGIKSANKVLKLHYRQVRKVDNARHCGLYEAGTPLAQNTFNPMTHRQQWELDCAESNIVVMSYPGVFANGRLDDGTALLLDALTGIHLEGEVLDFACGAGMIGACIAARNTSTRVTLLDTSALALRASQETLTANHVNGQILASNGLSEVSQSYDAVVTNPPIHAGVKTDNQLGMRLLDSIHEHINSGGMLILVANIHLPYEKWLTARFKKVTTLTANENFKVIMAIN